MMPLHTVRPNIVQAIRAFRVEDLQAAAQDLHQHFLYANLGAAQSKQEVLEAIAEAFTFPVHFGKNLDALFDCMTDLVHKSGNQPGFVVVLEQLPDNPSSTGRCASNCSTCSATLPTSGGNARYRSDASILFSSPLPGNRAGRAGRGSPERRQAGQDAGRHDHGGAAADEQRFRHRRMAGRGLR